ncbi:hypothetical protein [Rhodospirillaceae bacterium SYSU D60014]|uniref:hypothetical protein n=1 Tax=Virgifigura deserti TaxID=2268457 RepID=UPI000E673129
MLKAIAELLERRAALAARQEEIKLEIVEIDENLIALDRVLVLLDPSYRPSAPAKRRTKTIERYFGRGELSDATLAIPRDAKEPLTVADCAAAIVRAKALPDDTLGRVKANVAATLTTLVKRDRVRRLHNGDGHTVHWEIA